MAPVRLARQKHRIFKLCSPSPDSVNSDNTDDSDVFEDSDNRDNRDNIDNSDTYKGVLFSSSIKRGITDGICDA